MVTGVKRKESAVESGSPERRLEKKWNRKWSGNKRRQRRTATRI